MKKMPTLVFWAPYCGPFWTYWGVYKLAKNCLILKFRNIFYTKSKFKGGPFYEKNCHLTYIRPHCGGPFWKMGGLPIGPERTDLKIFQHFLTQKQNKKGVCSMKKKLPIHVFRVPFLGGLPIG
jgi:hypothetical protein